MSRPKIDWGAAFAFFVALGPTRTYAQVASRYGVSEGAVRRRSRLDDWPGRVRDVDEEARRRAEAAALGTLEERQKETIKVANKLRQIALQGEIDPKTAATVLHRFVKLERLFEGEATDVIGVAEVTRMLEVAQRVALRFVLEGEREAYLDALEAALTTGGGE